MFAADVPRRRRTALVVPLPPPAMAIDQESLDSKSGGAGPSGADDGSAALTSPSSPPPDSDEAAAAAAQLKSEEARKRKGKMLAVDQTLLCAKKDHAPLQPPVEKLMGDAIRVHVNQPHEADTLPFTAMKDVAFGDVAIGDGLRGVLRDLLGPVSPICVYEKKMAHADRDNEQNRLLISCKEKNRGGKCGGNQHRLIPFGRMFSHKEMLIVQQADQKQQNAEVDQKQKDNEERQENNGSKKQNRKRKRKEKAKKEKEEQDKPGLDVQAYDRNGQVYHLKCRYLTSNTAYRIIGKQWSDFLRKNNLLVEKTREKKNRRKGKKPSRKAEGCEGQSSTPSPEPNGDRPKQKIDNVRIELWAFRSRKLKLGCIDQTEGALGLVLLHYREEDGAEHVDAGRAGSEDVMKQEGSDHQGAAMPSMGLGVHEMVMMEVGPVDALEVALPDVIVEAPVDVPEVALQAAAVEAPVDVLPAVVEATGPQDEAAALVDVTDFVPSPFEWEAVESLLLLSRPTEKRLTTDGGGGCCIPATTCCCAPMGHGP